MENLLRRLDLTSLRLFAAACQEHSIARAAQREFIAPSAVSRRIAEIETLVGLPLIDRHQRGITPTPAGRTVLRYAEMLLNNVEAMGAELSRYFEGVQGKVRVVANLSAIVQFLPEDVAAFQRIYPDVDIDLEEQHSPHVLRMVLEREVDFGICTEVEGIEQFDRLPYRTDTLAVMVPANHRLAAEPSVAFESLLEERFVGLREDSALTRSLAAKAAQQGGDLNVKIRVTSLDALCRMVHADLGIAVLPLQVGALYLKSLDVALLPLTDVWAHRQSWIVTKQNAALDATAGTLLNFLIRPR